MAQRNTSIEIPICILEQIAQRAVIHGRSRNAEFRYLLNYALESLGDDDCMITLSGDEIKTITRFDYDVIEMLQVRCKRFQRPLGREIVRLAAYAIQLSTTRNIAIIEEMIRRRDREAA